MGLTQAAEDSALSYSSGGEQAERRPLARKAADGRGQWLGARNTGNGGLRTMGLPQAAEDSALSYSSGGEQAERRPLARTAADSRGLAAAINFHKDGKPP